jgi:hypothetical protein
METWDNARRPRPLCQAGFPPVAPVWGGQSTCSLWAPSALGDAAIFLHSQPLAGISILLVRRRKNTSLSARLATFLAFVPTAKPPSCPAGPLPRPKSRNLPDSEAISQAEGKTVRIYGL